MAEELAQEEHLIFICGHYEGYDERIKDLVTDEISLGDFVLTGGEVAATVIVDSVVRLLPGALGKAASHEDDSFSSGLLEYPQYTRPEEFRGKKVPSVLMSGHHENIRKWRLTESLKNFSTTSGFVGAVRDKCRRRGDFETAKDGKRKILMAWKNYIWDFDGTLFNTYPVMLEALREAMKQSSVEFPGI